MLRRKAYDELLKWKNRDGHKSLLIKGQHCTGKTNLVERFAEENYSHHIRLDLLDDASARSAFEGNLNVDTIVRNLGLLYGAENIVPGSTLIFMDGTNYCPKARTSMKSFTMDGRFDVIATECAPTDELGAFLPMGYEEHMTLRSLDFEEFLWAKGVSEDSISELRAKIRGGEPLSSLELSYFGDRFREYMIVGGMPEAVEAFLGNRDFEKIQHDILRTCISDIGKHGKGKEKLKTASCFRSLPTQLAQENKKFTYSRVDDDISGRRSKDRYGPNLYWLKESGYCTFCHAVTEPAIPLVAYQDFDNYKAFLSDTGLLAHMYGRDASVAMFEGDLSFEEGAVAENAVAECLVKSGYTPYYLRIRKGPEMMDLDLIAELPAGIAAIEVDSGKHRFAPSVSKAQMFPGIVRRISFGKENIHTDGKGVEHYPLFAVAFFGDIEGSSPFSIWEPILPVCPKRS